MSSPNSDLPSSSPLAVTVYSPESPLRNPMKLICDIFSDIWRTRELIGMLFMRDLKAAYRQTYLGYIWILLPAIATTAVWYYMTNQGLINVGKTPIPYPAFVMIGQIIWGTFTAAFGAPQLGFNGGSGVFMKLKVPPEAFIANACAKIVFDLLVKTLLIVAIFVIFWAELTLSWTVSSGSSWSPDHHAFRSIAGPLHGARGLSLHRCWPYCHLGYAFPDVYHAGNLPYCQLVMALPPP